jgi:hypothetical protein
VPLFSLGEKLLHRVLDTFRSRAGRTIGGQGRGYGRAIRVQQVTARLDRIVDPAEDVLPPGDEAIPALVVEPWIPPHPHVGICSSQVAVEQRLRRPAGSVVHVDIGAPAVLRE